MESVRYVLLDIEGTICPISFVKDTLFPHAIKALPDVLAAKWDDDAFKPYREAFPEKHRAFPQALMDHVADLTKRDVKVAYLKNLQGFLWEEGYRTGAYSTPLFPDVAPQLQRWKEAGLQLAIFSSGSVFAQKLLFEHVNLNESTTSKECSADETETGGYDSKLVETLSQKCTRVTGSSIGKGAGKKESEASESGVEESAAPRSKPVEDLRGLMSGWFDTSSAGSKTQASSYRNIVDSMKWLSSQTLFLSDNVQEIDAACEAGLKAILIDRPGNAPIAQVDRDRLKVAHSLDSIVVQRMVSAPSVDVAHDAQAAVNRGIENT
ncbi:hypothetical protein M433DRAFT_149955 [Acidomyces richmondensis BFW]|nr:MAG: hypothetical protein FE78DRAFT_93396 [Acidomyces sp. 'richmondensis']KYG49451.1 hypothetical protein M433DRAFT_149955 [Acidomyces richmondensis BFW]